jgi:alkylhydroperoxidase/carboxymuconolactone decarboxylase family protein YurZ
MEDIHNIFSQFKSEFPEIHQKHEASEKSHWLIKIAISAACNHKRALETHLQKASAAGITEDEIKHALLLLIPTAGFPAFMKSYAVLKSIK